MISRRPSIFIYTRQEDEDFLREICAGIEEEGLFYEIFPRAEGDVSLLAYEAARDSMLGSGIGLAGMDAALQLRGMKRGSNVEQYHMPTYQQCRWLGANSARAVKKQGFREA